MYETHYGFVWSTVRRLGVRPDAVDDAVQDAFLTAFRRWDDLPAECCRAWLYGIARRVCSNARRTEHRRTRKHEAFGLGQAQATRVEGRLQASALLDQFLAQLSDADRELFVLGAVEGLTGKELGAALQRRPSTLYGRLERLRRRFVALVGDVAPADLVASPPRSKAAAGWLALAPALGTATVAKTGLGVALAVGLVASVGAGVVTMDRPGVPATPTRSEPLEVTPRVEPPPQAPVAAAPVLKPPAPAVAPKRARRTKPAVDRVRAEAALVTAMRAAAGQGDVSGVLTRAAEHEQRFPDGVLADAVAVLQVEALCDAGRADDARRVAAAALRARPGSVVGRRLASACPAPVVKPRASGHGSD